MTDHEFLFHIFEDSPEKEIRVVRAGKNSASTALYSAS